MPPVPFIEEFCVIVLWKIESDVICWVRMAPPNAAELPTMVEFAIRATVFGFLSARPPPPPILEELFEIVELRIATLASSKERPPPSIKLELPSIIEFEMTTPATPEAKDAPPPLPDPEEFPEIVHPEIVTIPAEATKRPPVSFPA
jgi:hypothetical protein